MCVILLHFEVLKYGFIFQKLNIILFFSSFARKMLIFSLSDTLPCHVYCRVRGLRIYIRAWALFEDA